MTLGLNMDGEHQYYEFRGIAQVKKTGDDVTFVRDICNYNQSTIQHETKLELLAYYEV